MANPIVTYNDKIGLQVTDWYYTVERKNTNPFILKDWDLVTDFKPITNDFTFKLAEDAENVLRKYIDFKRSITKPTNKVIKIIKL
jgi:hypothetical protein